MDRLQGMKVFVRVAQRASFTAAARALRMSPGAVSKHVSALESQVGARLLDRTTRRVGLTEAGRVYLERCQECLQAIEDADASVGELSREPRGLLRVSAPVDFGDRLLAPILAEVFRTSPELVIDLQLSNRVVGLVEEGIDVSIRVATGLDGRFVARPIARTRLAIVASPDYLRRHGRPRKPEDLASHRSLVFCEPRPMDELRFTRGRREVRVKLRPVMTSNNGTAIRTAAAAGVGICTMPSFLGGGDLESGRVEPLLLDWSLPELRVFAVYPHRRFLSAKVRVFVEALRATFGDGTRDPWWPTASRRQKSV